MGFVDTIIFRAAFIIVVGAALFGTLYTGQFMAAGLFAIAGYALFDGKAS